MIPVHPVSGGIVWLNPGIIAEVYASSGNPTGAYVVVSTTTPASMEVTETVAAVVQAVQAAKRAGS